MVIPKKGFGCVYLALTSDYSCRPLVDQVIHKNIKLVLEIAHIRGIVH